STAYHWNEAQLVEPKFGKRVPEEVPKEPEVQDSGGDKKRPPEVQMFFQWIDILAKTSNEVQRREKLITITQNNPILFLQDQIKLSLDYLNRNFDDLLANHSADLAPHLEHLVHLCIKQYLRFPIVYYPANQRNAKLESASVLFHA